MTAGWECNHCWTDPDISHRVEVCWMWERTLPFNPKALPPSQSLLYVLGKCCMGSTSRQQKAHLRPVLPPPAHSTHLGRSTGIIRRAQFSWPTAKSAQRSDPTASLGFASVCLRSVGTQHKAISSSVLKVNERKQVTTMQYLSACKADWL